MGSKRLLYEMQLNSTFVRGLSLDLIDQVGTTWQWRHGGTLQEWQHTDSAWRDTFALILPQPNSRAAV